jgi:acetyl-CoA decarbonylase/synthase complex subunit delta
LAFEIPKQAYSGRIGETTLGTGDGAVTVGGATSYPFHVFEGDLPHPPKIAMEIWDYDPSEEWPAAAVEPFKDVIASPDAWAKKCVEEYGADIIVLQLKSTDPNGMDRGPEEAAEVTKKVVDAIDAPLVVWGTANNQKDEEVLKRISEVCDGKNLGLSPVEEANHKGVGASALGYKHVVVASTPIDVNLAKQLNILLGNLGVSQDKIIIDPTTGGLGYGIEYSYSVMERIKMAALTQEDDKLQIPMITNLGNEIWKCKEAGESIEEVPAMGDPERRAVLMEVVGAVCYLMAGSDVLVLRHPESARMIRTYIDLMVNGGSAADVAGISKILPPEVADLLAISPEPDLAFGGEGAPEEKPKKEAAKPKAEKKEKPAEPVKKEEKAPPKAEKVVEMKPKVEKKEKPAEPAKKEEKAPPKEEKVVEMKPKAEEPPKAEVEPKAEGEAEAKAKAVAEAKAKAEAEAKAKAEEEAKAKAEAEAKAKAEADAKAKAKAKEKEKEELLALRQKRAKERAELEAKRKAEEGVTTTRTPAPEQLSLVDKLILNLERIHKHS